jgi:hypothetical protein
VRRFGVDFEAPHFILDDMHNFDNKMVIVKEGGPE